MARPLRAARPAANEPRNEEAPKDDKLRRQIAEAAYYRAEQRGFAPGREMEDWLEAETEVKSRIDRGGG